MATGFDRDHGLSARASSRRRHELGRSRNGFNIKENGAAFHITGQIIEHVAKIDISGIPDGDNMTEANILSLRPLQHRRRQRSRLQDECDGSGLCKRLRETGIELYTWHLDADAVRADDAQKIWLCRIQHLLLKIARYTCCDDDCRPATPRAKFGDELRNRSRRRCNDREGGREGKLFHNRVARNALDRGIARIYKGNLTGKTGAAYVIGNR